VTIFVAAQRQWNGVEESLSAETLRMVKWNNSDVAQHLLAFQATEPYFVESSGALPLADSERSVSDTAELLGTEAHEGPVFSLAQASERAAIQLALKPGQYEADIQLDATIRNDEVRQSYQLTATPRSSRIDRVLVVSNVPLGETVHWTEQSTGRSLSAERVTAAEPSRATLPPGAEVWSVQLPQPVVRRTGIIASRVSRLTGRSPLPLLSAPEAAMQQGRVIVRCDDHNVPELISEQLQPIPIPIEAADSQQTAETAAAVAAFRYEPTLVAEANVGPQLSVGPKGSSRFPAVLIRHADLQSYYTADGRGVHRATFQLTKQGADHFTVELPATAANLSLMVDERELELPADMASGRSLPIRLPSNSPAAMAVLNFATRHAPLSAGAVLEPPLQSDVPILAGSWTVWLPNPFDVNGAVDSPFREQFNVRERLFGLLGRPLRSNKSLPFSDVRAAAALTSITTDSLSEQVVRDLPADERVDSEKTSLGPRRGMGGAGSYTNDPSAIRFRDRRYVGPRRLAGFSHEFCRTASWTAGNREPSPVGGLGHRNFLVVSRLRWLVAAPTPRRLHRRGRALRWIRVAVARNLCPIRNRRVLGAAWFSSRRTVSRAGNGRFPNQDMESNRNFGGFHDDISRVP
jgi:hypothetical protein